MLRQVGARTRGGAAAFYYARKRMRLKRMLAHMLVVLRGGGRMTVRLTVT